jgi:ArsR family transcriptional regulator, arsenate/arsenite/antimonite-responsive transcriptional repressor
LRATGGVCARQDQAVATADVFKALADPARVRIVNALAGSSGPVCACEFEPALGLSTAPAARMRMPTR